MKSISGNFVLRITLPRDRDRVGTIEVLDKTNLETNGRRYRIAARASDEIAEEHGNPSRLSTLPFGDPPTGSYRIIGIASTGEGTKYRSDLFGDGDVVKLCGADGNAALADATGRFEILIHGGPLSSSGALRMTTGHFRVSDDTLAELVEQVNRLKIVSCECLETHTSQASEHLGELVDLRTSPPAADRLNPPLRRALVHDADLVAYGEYSTPMPPKDSLSFGGTAMCQVKTSTGQIQSCSVTIGLQYTYDNARIEANVQLEDKVKQNSWKPVNGTFSFKYSW